MTQTRSVVIGPDEGLSLWQPQPSRGYVTVNLMPETSPYDSFSSGVQVLPPGCQVREHGHRRNHELVFIYEGEGEVVINDVAHPLTPGATVLFAENDYHLINNTGDVDMKMFWVFFPPGLENWFKAIGRPRAPGAPMPEPFARPDDVADIMRAQDFLPPRS
ncbi:MAG: cupin domain-containing protein [Caulobacterales bacterium]|nr:cupin domain-containing protein [Caulobacterales bacterium]